MKKVSSSDLFTSEEQIEVDAETAAAIKRGLRDAKEGRVVPSEKVRELVHEWISKFSTAKPR